MAYNKNNYENQNLTPKQEKFVDGILEGKSQTEAYLEAYPKAKDWKRDTVWERASVLMHNNKVVTRLHELRVERQDKSTINKRKNAKKNR